MDILSEVLTAIRLTGGVFFDIHATAPWVLGSPHAGDIRQKVMPGAQHIIPFHFVMSGPVWFVPQDATRPSIELNAGDVILMPRGRPHSMASEPGLRAEPDMRHYYRPTDQQLPFQIAGFGGGGAAAHLVCGYFGCDTSPFNPLLGALPDETVIRAHPSHDCVAALFVQAALDEHKANRPGGEIVLAKLSELMLVQVMRVYIDSLPDGVSGWFGGLRDPFVSRALQLIHGDPSREWTLHLLAREAGLSRSALADRFVRFVKLPPMQYLAHWRMQVASHALALPGASMSSIAADVGYQSEAAFNRAFKRVVGVPPGQWRRDRPQSRAA